MSRRRVLQTIGAVSIAGLAGCLGDSDDTTDAGPGDEDSDDSSEDDGGHDDSDDSSTINDDDSPNRDSTEMPRLRDVITMETSYVMEMTFSAGSSTTTFYNGDSHMTGTFQGQEMESYRIGNDTYTVMDGQCFTHSIDPPEDDSFDPEEPGDDTEEYYATDRTTVNGQEVYVFDLGDGIYYVSVSTGHPVRFESTEEDAVVDFHSWGDTAPISPPDMNCH